MFRYEKCSHQAVHCANHGWNMIILSMIETTSRVSFNLDQTKHVQDGGWMQVGNECPKDPKLGILWGELSNWNMGQRRASKLAINQTMNAIVTAISISVLRLKCDKFLRVAWNSINYATMHETCLKPTSGVNNTITNMFRRTCFVRTC